MRIPKSLLATGAAVLLSVTLISCGTEDSGPSAAEVSRDRELLSDQGCSVALPEVIERARTTLDHPDDYEFSTPISRNDDGLTLIAVVARREGSAMTPVWRVAGSGGELIPVMGMPSDAWNQGTTFSDEVPTAAAQFAQHCASIADRLD